MTENLCPRCGERPLHPRQVMNALSRKDNATYVCSPCGTDEAFMVDPWPGFPATLDINAVTYIYRFEP